MQEVASGKKRLGTNCQIYAREGQKKMAGDCATVQQVKQKLVQNNFKCSLTGWNLSPDGFCLDHIVPIAAGGDDSIGNLECVHPVANAAKGTMGKAEFVAMCRAVAANCKEEDELTPSPYAGSFLAVSN